MKSSNVFVSLVVLVAAFPPSSLLFTWSFSLPNNNNNLSPHPLPITVLRSPVAASTTRVVLRAARTNDGKKPRGGGGSSGSAAGEGFGKSSSVRAKQQQLSSNDDMSQQLASSSILASLPTESSETNNNNNNNFIVKEDVSGLSSPEERSQAILRQKFGLKSYEEQQADLGNYRATLNAEQKNQRRSQLRNLDKLWPEDKDLLSVLPPSLIKGVDSFLKAGLALSTLAFISAGIFITIEAGSKATGRPLPEGLENWVVNVVEPNFTPGLGVLLAFSVSLGLFSVALGGSASSTYRENR